MMMQIISGWLDTANAILWGVPMLVLLVGTHLFFTVRLGFIQRLLLPALKLSFSFGKRGAGDISHFGALATALAATVGTGNIVGVATAIGSGGPGAVFWMWVTGIIGMATKYAEALLALKYRQVNEKGEMIGGPMEVILRGLGWKWLAVFFAACALLASFGIGNMNQANSIVLQVKNIFPELSAELAGVVLAVLTGAVMLGGVRWIAKVCEVFVPFMIVFYILGSLVILGINFDAIPGAFATILKSAFSTEAVGGGLLGTAIAQAMRYGISRGLFSNESGMGSGGFFAAAAKTRNPMQQALVSMTGTFWDTVVICLMTGLVIVASGAWTQVDASGMALKGSALTSAAFAQVPYVGAPVLTIVLLTFVFSTIVGWSYIGEKSAEYLFGLKAIFPFRLVWVLVVYVGSVSKMELVWNFSDFANALMCLPNILSLLLLSGIVASETRRCLADPLTFQR